MAKISILISNFNNGEYFNDCFNSLILQTETDWEAIIIDDCSTDNSLVRIKKLIALDRRFKLYKNNENIGYQLSTIRAISLATAPLFARVDPDDALTPRAIESVISAYSSFPNVGLVYSNFIWCDSSLSPQSVHKAKQITLGLGKDFHNMNGEISHFACFKKEIYQQTSGIDPFIKRAEDKDIYMKMCEVAQVKYIDEDLYMYRIHNKGLSNLENVDRAFFWHWVAMIKMSERTGVNLEDLFWDHFSRKSLLTRVKKAGWAKLGNWLGLFKVYKDL